MASASEHAVVWNRPAARAVPARRQRIRRPRADPRSERLAVCLARPGGRAHRAGRPQRRQRRRRPDRGGAGRRRSGRRRRGPARLRGARRRFERLGETAGGVPVYDDYAHHPTEVAAALAAARTLAPARLIAIFQPHLHSRTAGSGPGVRPGAGGADIVGVLGVYPARERAEDFPGVDGRLIATAAADAAGGRPVAWLPGFAQARQFLAATRGGRSAWSWARATWTRWDAPCWRA